MSTVSAFNYATAATKSTSSSSSSSSSSDTDSSILSQDDFMLLLVTELTNQDPLEPMSNQEMVSQIAEMQSLDETINQTELMTEMTEQLSLLSNYMSYMTYDNRLQAASSLVGMYVTGTDSSGNEVEGMVLNATMNSGEVTLTLHSGDTLSYDNVTDVTQTVIDSNESETSD